MKSFLTFFIVLLTIADCFSQDKLEREYRIKLTEVPQSARDFIKESFGAASMKWHGEENLSGRAIEAKGKYKGKLYSVKFTPDGILQDVEMVVSYGSLPEDIQKNIEQQLGQHFSNFRIQRTQIQWLGDKADLRSLIQGNSIRTPYKTNYEITLKGTADRRSDYYEVLVNDQGELIRKSKIVQRNNHNLIY